MDLGPAMIFAGPGSGKTFILTHRILHYIRDCNIKPSEILVFTFTRAAANEMKERFYKIHPQAANNVIFGTFHSVFYYFLKDFSKSVPNIISSKEKHDFLKQLVKTFDYLDFYSDVEALSFDFSKYKNSNENFDLSFALNEEEKKYFLLLYNEYQNYLKAFNYMDYDDILIFFYKLLLSCEDIRFSIQKRFRAILIDEFQDINEIQYNIISQIIPDNRNIFVVGDDDQSIYGFRGAKSAIMKTFLEDFNDAFTVNLENNYRSSQSIIDASHRLISHNTSRMKSGHQISCSGREEGLFEIMYFSNKKEMEAYIRSFVQKNEFENMGLLCRTNKDCYYYKEMLNNKKLSDNNINMIYYEMLSDLEAYMEFSHRRKRRDFVKILNKPLRYIPSSLISEDIVDLKALSKRSLGTVYGNNFQILCRHMKVLDKAASLPFVKYLFEIMGYMTYIKEKYPDKKADINLYYVKIKEKACCLKSLMEFKEWIGKELKKEDVKRDDNSLEKVAVTTYHSSKGLEFDCVLLPDLYEGNVPGRISIKNDNLEEERRLFYVAMTRARRKLILLTIKNEESTSVLPSRFITEITSKSND